MKAFIDFLPVLLFFLSYIFYGNIISSNSKCFQIQWHRAFNDIDYKSKPVCSDQEFEDKDIFNKKYIDEDWEIALLVYPELEIKKKKLSKYLWRRKPLFERWLWKGNKY